MQVLVVFFYSLQGAAFVEFDVHLSKDHVPVVYHDLTCCMAMKKVYMNVLVIFLLLV